MRRSSTGSLTVTDQSSTGASPGLAIVMDASYPESRFRSVLYVATSATGPGATFTTVDGDAAATTGTDDGCPGSPAVGTGAPGAVASSGASVPPPVCGACAGCRIVVYPTSIAIMASRSRIAARAA